MKNILYLLLIILILPGCTDRKPAAIPVDSPAIEAENANVRYDRAVRELAGRIAEALDDRQLAAQVLVTGIDGKGNLHWLMRSLLEDCPAGGIMLFRYNLDTDTGSIQALIAETAELVASGNAVSLEPSDAVPEEAPVVRILPFMAVDHEGGVVNRFLPGVADLPGADSYRTILENEGMETALARINADSANVGTKIKRIGINMNIAPIAEQINDDNFEFLDDRSYGRDPLFVAEASEAFIAGMKQAGIICVIKHFPGNAGADPHYFPSVLRGDKAEMAEQVSPFAALISKGIAEAMMVSHSAVPSWDSENIASLSPAVMGNWLRQELGFEGIIICDDFSMTAASGMDSSGNRISLKPETAAVRSLAAGADMVLVWPMDLKLTHHAIQAAIDDGTLSRERLRESAARIIFAKIKMGIIVNEE